jgi:hypothetical protein
MMNNLNLQQNVLCISICGMQRAQVQTSKNKTAPKQTKFSALTINTQDCESKPGYMQNCAMLIDVSAAEQLSTT